MSPLCEHHREYLHTPGWEGPVLLCYKPGQHVIVLVSLGNCNTMASICVSEHRKGAEKHSIKDKKWHAYIWPSVWLVLAGLDVALGESVREWWVTVKASQDISVDFTNTVPQGTPASSQQGQKSTIKVLIILHELDWLEMSGRIGWVRHRSA